MSDKKSLLQNKKGCYVCGATENLHYHHIFEGMANRRKSDEDSMGVYLCGPHHNLSSMGIHYNKALDDKVKKQAEKIWIKTYCDKDLTPEEKIEQFIKRYGQNYLNEEDLW